jgi:excisionase family DNA binding protein
MQRDDATPTAWPGAMTLDVAAAYLSVSRSQLDRMVDDGRLGPRPVQFGQRAPRLIKAELDRWLAAGAPRRPQWLAMQDQHHHAA